jgi:hypothetical protein
MPGMGWSAEARAVVIAIVATILLVLLGGLLGLTSGQLFVTGIAAALIGLVAAGSGRPRPWVARFALGLGVGMVIAGAVGSWLVALAQGGTLGLLDYAWATSGLLVPFEIVIALLAAAWGARNGPIRG